MVTFTKGLYPALQSELHAIGTQSESYLAKAEKAMGTIAVYLKQLLTEENTYEFKDPEEEIRYFKDLKPMFLREKIFYLKQYEIESRRPVSAPDVVQEFYRAYLPEVEHFFEDHRFLYLYYQLGKDNLDPKFFTREPEGVAILPQYRLSASVPAENIYTYIFAKFQAYEDLYQFLNLKISGNDEVAFMPSDKTKPVVVWEGTKAQFYEMIYGLVSAGIIKTDVKTAMETLAPFLGIKPGNYYGYFMAMRIRKKDRTPFFTLLKNFTERRMDESDEHPRFH